MKLLYKVIRKYNIINEFYYIRIMWYNNFKRKQLEISNYAGVATLGADILDTLLEIGNEEVPNLKSFANS